MNSATSSFSLFCMRHAGSSTFILSRPISNLRTLAFFIYISLSTIPANTRLFACSHAHTHTHIIAYQHIRKEENPFFLFAYNEREKKNKESERERATRLLTGRE